MSSPEKVENSAKLRKTTAALLVISAVGLLLWDIDVATNDVKDDTISELLRDISHRFWILPFMLMGVMGHLFWNRSGRKKTFKPGLLIGASVLVGSRDLLNWAVELPTWPYANLVLGVLGFLAGALWWPQLVPEDKQPEQPPNSEGE